MALAPSLLPPPVFDMSRCAAGGDGIAGCRACVQGCPYQAIVAREGPNGTEIHIDAGQCHRCGACTALCPTSSLERSFLPDAELRAMVVDAAVGGRPVLVSGPCHEGLAARASEDGWATVEVPSVLVIDEVALLAGLRAGAVALAVVGCDECHHDALHLVQDHAEVAAQLSGRHGSILVADSRAAGLDEALATMGREAKPEPREMPIGFPGPSEAPRRSVLAQLLADMDPTDDAETSLVAGFGHISVEDEGCTMCGACARTCPTGSIQLSDSDGVLSARDVDCVECGLCVTACPEQVISLRPAVASQLVERRTLVVDEMVPCAGCGEPHLPARLLAHAKQVVRDSGRPPTRSSRQLDLCPSCRVVADEGLRVTDDDGRPTPVGLPQLDRRSFLVGSAATVGGVLGMIATGAEPAAAQAAPVEPAGRLGMVIDIGRCIGCHACTAACKAENHVPLGVYRDWVEEYVQGTYPDARPVFVPKLCNHCTDPGCMRACPTGAIFRRSDGIVDLDHSMCIGCRACNQACPYGATFVDPVRHTADKCNLCAHRVDEGLRPACVDVCPSQCRVFGDLDDPNSAPSQLIASQPTDVLRPELGLGPNVHYVGLPSDPGEPTTAVTTGTREL